MNTFFADIFSTLLKLLHILVILGLVIFVGMSNSYSSGPLSLVYAIVLFIVYVVIVGFISVVLSMHENLAAIRKLMEINSAQSQDESVKKIDTNHKKEPIYEQEKN